MTAEFLSPAEAAEIVGRHPVTLRDELRAGRLHGFQRGKGGHWVIRPACLEAWMECRPCEHQQSNVRPLRGRAVS